ncbi:MAG TPA: exopolysaccharide biosynthesis protein [Deltaproteobacteria bacterium]|nr:exopolysaccharide biosynthesis protein [Deltaproteobacteria bacterium]
MSKLRKALEKAKESRQHDDASYKEAPRQTASESEGMVIMPERASHDTAVEKINPSYLQTKVCPIDFENLEKKRIISICHGNMVADRIKILRTQILNHLREAGGNTLLIASANSGEGRTVTAINLAIALSQQIDGTVLLVDSDLRNPSIHTLLGIDVTKGLSDYLRGKAEIPELLINPGIPRLVILPGGKPLVNSSELLGAPKMKLLVKEMKERYADRIIIFDSSPLLDSADSMVLSRFIDGILIVVEAEKTTKEDLKRTLELLKERPVIGTVFNKARG